MKRTPENHFTNRHSGAEAVYESHPLFRTFLLSQAQRTYSRVQIADIQRRAGELADAADMADAAVSLLHEAEDWCAPTDVVCRRVPLLAQGRTETVERWFCS